MTPLPLKLLLKWICFFTTDASEFKKYFEQLCCLACLKRFFSPDKSTPIWNWLTALFYKIFKTYLVLSHSFFRNKQEETTSCEKVIIYSILLILTDTYHLLTKSEVITGKSQNESLTRSIQQGLGLRFPYNDWTDNVNKLFFIWPFWHLFL